MSDEFDERAVRILPCREIVKCRPGEFILCVACSTRPTLAAEFRADAEIINQLRDSNLAFLNERAQWIQAQAEIISLKEKYKAELCTCDAQTDDPCLKHKRENELQDLWLSARAELERTQTALGQANADLMGCRDGALVRDLRAENEFLKNYQDSIRNGDRVVEERDQLRYRLEQAEKERERWQEDSLRQAQTIQRMAAAAQDRNEVDKKRHEYHQADLAAAQIEGMQKMILLIVEKKLATPEQVALFHLALKASN